MDRNLNGTSWKVGNSFTVRNVSVRGFQKPFDSAELKMSQCTEERIVILLVFFNVFTVRILVFSRSEHRNADIQRV